MAFTIRSWFVRWLRRQRRYCYYKSLSKPVICHKFTKERTADTDDAEDTANFVSSVCWKKNSNVLLAANSLGTISVR